MTEPPSDHRVTPVPAHDPPTGSFATDHRAGDARPPPEPTRSDGADRTGAAAGGAGVRDRGRTGPWRHGSRLQGPAVRSSTAPSP